MEHLRSLDGGDDFDAIIWHLILMLGGCGGVVIIDSREAMFKTLDDA